MKPRLALIMGSTSDLPQVEPSLTTLRELGIPFTLRVLSAHRTPVEAGAFAAGAADQGLEVIIAVAGAAAHLAGAMTAHTDLPVIGVPLNATSLAGLDALLATVQMPGGVPVATMGIGRSGVKNAVIFAARILARGDKEVAARLASMRRAQARKVLAADEETREKYSWRGDGA